MAKRRTRSRASKSKKLEPRKRIIIATEGSKTEQQYFNTLKKELRLGNVELLKKGTKSSPDQAVKRLDKYKETYSRELNKHDELWLVIDNDGRSEQTLNKVLEQAKQNKYHLADSNPCFELWLLLHYESLDRLRGLEGSAATGGCASVEKELKKFDETYDKSRYEPGKYIEKINKAIKNAKETDTQPDDRWLNQIGTRVYRLAQSIIASAPSAKHVNN